MRREDLVAEVRRVLDRYAEEKADRIYVLSELLYSGTFLWSSTGQGHDYWSNIRNELKELADERRGGPSANTSEAAAVGGVADVIGRVEQLIKDIKAALEEGEKWPHPTIRFLTYAVHQLEGREGSIEQRGLLEKLKDLV